MASISLEDVRNETVDLVRPARFLLRSTFVAMDCLRGSSFNFPFL